MNACRIAIALVCFTLSAAAEAVDTSLAIIALSDRQDATRTRYVSLHLPYGIIVSNGDTNSPPSYYLFCRDERRILKTQHCDTFLAELEQLPDRATVDRISKCTVPFYAHHGVKIDTQWKQIQAMLAQKQFRLISSLEDDERHTSFCYCESRFSILANTDIPARPRLERADAVPLRQRPLLGVQRWDMYSGKGATQQQEIGYRPGKQGFLKPAQWHDRAPFFCRLTRDVDWVAHPSHAGPLWCNSPFDRAYLQKSMDQEIRYAVNAGIDFFVYHGPARSLFSNGWELKNNLDAHMSSTIPDAQQMKFTWALYGHDAVHYTRSKVASMMDETMHYIRMPHWQTVLDGRPLILVLWPGNFKRQLEALTGNERMTSSEFVAYVRARVKGAGLRNPYVVGMTVPARSFLQAAALKKDGYDAFMDYAGGYGGALARQDESPTYAEATQELVRTLNTSFLNRELPFIPPCTSIQYPWPRALDHTTGKPTAKWYHYQWPETGDMAARIKAVFDFVAAHPGACEAQTVIMYSWNEHSEGGGLCPTMGTPPAYKPVTTWLDEVAAALTAWHYDREPEGAHVEK